MNEVIKCVDILFLTVDNKDYLLSQYGTLTRVNGVKGQLIFHGDVCYDDVED